MIYVRGHSPGTIAPHLPSAGLLIGGDAINHRQDRLGPPPPKRFTVDVNQAIASIHRMAELEFDIFCPGHGASFVSGADKVVRVMVRGLG